MAEASTIVGHRRVKWYNEPQTYRRGNSDTRAGRLFDTVIYALIVVSLITFSIETLPNLPPTASEVLYWIELTTVLLFTGEYVLRLAVAEPRGQFVRSFFGLLDLVAIPAVLPGSRRRSSCRADIPVTAVDPDPEAGAVQRRHPSAAPRCCLGA